MNTPNKRVGRPRAYTPEALEAKFEEYAEWAKANPRYSNKVLADGSIIPLPYERPLTLSGFAVFAGIIPETFREYEKLDEFSVVCARVRARIESDQLEGAMCEQYNSTIASRVHACARESNPICWRGLCVSSTTRRLRRVFCILPTART